MTEQPVDPDADIATPVDHTADIPTQVDSTTDVPTPVDDTADIATPTAPVPATRSHAFLRYTTARIALFVLAVFVVWLTRLASGVLLVIIALFISGLASFALLGRQRAEVSASLFGRQERRRARRLAGRVDDEDDDDEAYEHGSALYTPEFYNRENR